ncbi:MAG TPA: HI0074 family nucleotidyltransferase substrate-binding subunit [Rhizomicrobium sp.]
MAIDGTIQRFECVFELYWKAMKALLEMESPAAPLGTARSVIKAAYAAGWIDDEGGWLDLLDMRNATSHTYREATARDVYQRVCARLPLLKATLPRLKQKLP